MITAAGRRNAVTALLVIAVVGLTGAALIVGGWGWPQWGRASDGSSTLLDQLPIWLLMVGAAAVTIGTAMTLVRRLTA